MRALLLVPVLSFLSAAHAVETPTMLSVGQTLENRIEDGGEGVAPVHTETLDDGYSRKPAVGRRYSIEVTESGTFTIDLRSSFFDTYLVLRDAEGELLTEDDDGWLETHSRIVTPLEAGQRYTIDACALHGKRGAFDLTLRRGASVAPELDDRIADAERVIADIEAEGGPASSALANAHYHLAELCTQKAQQPGHASFLARGEEAMRHVIEIRTKVLGKDRIETAWAFDYCGYICHAQGRHRDAIPLMEESLRICRLNREEGHPDIAHALTQLGIQYEHLGELPRATPLYREAVVISEHALGAAHPDTLQRMNWLGKNLERSGKTAEAESIALRAIELLDAATEPNPGLLISHLNLLGLALMQEKRFADAVPVAERSLAAMQSWPSASPVHLGQTLYLLGVAYFELGQVQEARERLALAANVARMNGDPIFLGAVLSELGRAQMRTGLYAEGCRTHQEALAILENTAGLESPDFWEAYLSFLELLMAAGDQTSLRQLTRQYGPAREAWLLRSLRAMGDDAPLKERVGFHAELGYYHRSVEDAESARSEYERALALCQQMDPVDEAVRAQMLSNIGETYHASGRYAEALPYMEQALELRTRISDPGLELALAYTQVAASLHGLNRNREAEERIREAIRLYEASRGPQHLDTLLARAHLARILAESDAYDASRKQYERVLEGRRAILGDQHPDVAEALSGLGTLLISTYELEEGERLHREAIAILDELSDDAAQAMRMKILRSFSAALHKCGRLEEARRISGQAVAIARSFSDERGSGTLTNHAAILIDFQEYEEAGSLLSEALTQHERVRSKDHPATVDCLQTLALVRFHLGQPESAVALLERVVAINEQALGATNTRTCHAMRLLGEILIEIGEHDRAVETHMECLERHIRALGEDHPETALTRAVTGRTLHKVERLEEGSELLEEALPILDEALAPSNPIVGTVRRWLFYAYGSARRFREAVPVALDLLDARIDRFHSELALSPGRQRLKLVASLYMDWCRGLSVGKADPLTREEGSEFWSRITALKGSVFRLESRVKQELSRLEGDPQLATTARELRRIDRELSALTYDKKIDDPKAHAARFESLTEERAATERRILDFLGQPGGSDRTTAAELGELLSEGSALLDFVLCWPWHFANEPGCEVVGEHWHTAEVLCWIVRHGETAPRVVNLGEAPALRDTVQNYLQFLEDQARGVSKVSATENVAQQAIRENLWEPLAQHLEGCTKLFIVPDEPLTELPFGALPVTADRYLIEFADVVYAEDPLTLKELLVAGSPDRDASPSVVAIGGVDYDARPEGSEDGRLAIARTTAQTDRAFSRNFAPLAHTSEEIDTILALHRQAFDRSSATTRLVGADATEDAFRQAVAGRTVVHLATHGFFLRDGIASQWQSALERARADEPIGIGRAASLTQEETVSVKIELDGEPPELLSGFALAGVNSATGDRRDDTEHADGILTAAEVWQLDLAECDLAVLSACETALGAGHRGEGLLSLRRAFREAGAKTVIASLWQVDDEATRILLTSFYRYLWIEKRSPSAALRAAQLDLLRGDRFRSPRYWAAFTLSGHWE